MKNKWIIGGLVALNVCLMFYYFKEPKWTPNQENLSQFESVLFITQIEVNQSVDEKCLTVEFSRRNEALFSGEEITFLIKMKNVEGYEEYQEFTYSSSNNKLVVDVDKYDKGDFFEILLTDVNRVNLHLWVKPEEV